MRASEFVFLLVATVAIMLAMLFAENGNASTCSKPVSYLLENHPAPCTGYLFTPQQEALSRAIMEKYALQLQITDNLTQQIDIQKKELNLASSSLAVYRSQKTQSAFEKWLFFAAGVVLVIGIEKATAR